MAEIRAELKAQHTIQDMIAHQVPLADTLSAICQMIELQFPGALCSIMLFDPALNTLNLAAGSSFSERYQLAMQGVIVGPNVGTCGTAAFHELPIISEDILTDPRWRDFRSAAVAENLRACWSVPILSLTGELLGSFATYHRSVKRPSDYNQKQVHRAGGLAALAISRNRDRQFLQETEQRYRSLFLQHPDAIFEVDLAGCFRSGNDALALMAGAPMADIKGKHYKEFVLEEHQVRADRAFDLACRGESQHYELTGVGARGQHYNLEVTNLPIVVDGQVVGVYGIARDVTRRKQQESELRLLRRGIEASINGVVIADANQPGMPLVYANKAFLTITGYSRDEVLGRNCRFLQGAGTDPEAVTQIRHALAEKKETQVALRNYRKDGTPFWNNIFIGPVRDELGHCTHFVGIQSDISLHKAYEEQLSHHATHDMLTGLINRKEFDRQLQYAYSLSQRNNSILAVLFIDLDNFKQINEGLGHDVGDELLIAATRRLKALLAPDDSLARLNGDDFAMLLPNRSHEQQILARAEQVLSALARVFEVNDLQLQISGSVGIVSNRDHVQSPGELVRCAELAKQDAKQQGRNTWQWYSGNKAAVVSEHVALRYDLNEAIRQEQFELHYQPIVDAVTGRLLSVEALARWKHPKKGMIPPDVFIPLAEHTGQIIAIGRWVLKRACMDMMALQAEGYPAYPVAVNISPLQFRRDGFLQELRGVLEQTGLAPTMLELELTEGVLMSGADEVIATLHAIRAMGIQVAIDDFGTGFSSLRYLRQLPVQKVKLDRSFIRDITTNRDNAAIVQGVITMAHHLGLTVIAEGVETREQQADLVSRECDLLQGYFFARPMSLEALKRICEQSYSLPVP